MTPSCKTLSHLDTGGSGIIRSITETSPSALRPMDLGFIPGTPVTLLHRAPMGDPMIFMIRGYRIGLRKLEASMIGLE